MFMPVVASRISINATCAKFRNALETRLHYRTVVQFIVFLLMTPAVTVIKTFNCYS